MDGELVCMDRWREDSEALNAILERAGEGDRSVAPLLRQIIRERPDVWRRWGDWSARTMDIILKPFERNDLLYQSVRRYAKELRDSLNGDEPTPIELLLVERIVLCWLHLSIAEGEYSVSPTHERHKRFDRAQRMYLQALKALVLTRRMQIPPFQVNIADKQINVLSDSHPDTEPSNGGN